MTFCDYQIFWHQHRQRPPLPRGLTMQGGEREVMKDDGSIVMEYQKSFAEIWIDSGAQKMIEDYRKETSPLWGSFAERK